MEKYVQTNSQGYVVGFTSEPILAGLFGGRVNHVVSNVEAEALESILVAQHQIGEGLHVSVLNGLNSSEQKSQRPIEIPVASIKTPESISRVQRIAKMVRELNSNPEKMMAARARYFDEHEMELIKFANAKDILLHADWENETPTETNEES